MKRNIINPTKARVLLANEIPCTVEKEYARQEKDALTIYGLAYAHPFVPAVDLTFVYYELREWVQSWLLMKREGRNQA